jgi:4-diphosphocytidyl-2-C-methyl-D-erythritol kinase
MKKSVRLPAFAKVNLCLHILGRCPDGYHELRTVFQTIGLRDTLELSPSREPGIQLQVSDSSLSTGADNLVYRAIEAIGCEIGFRGGIHAKLTKRIPVARGLGGGSSDAAAALIGMLRLTGKDLPLAKLMEIASRLGADVPFFLFGGRAVAVNRGDEIYPLDDGPKRTVVVVSPRGIGVSTKDAYQWVSAELTKRANVPNIWEFCALCWRRQEAVSNDFEVPVFSRHPRLGEIRDALLAAGAAEAALAGSGSAVFGIFRNPAQARRAARKFPEDSVFVVETLSREKYGSAMGWSLPDAGSARPPRRVAV